MPKTIVPYTIPVKLAREVEKCFIGVPFKLEVTARDAGRRILSMEGAETALEARDLRRALAARHPGAKVTVKPWDTAEARFAVALILHTQNVARRHGRSFAWAKGWLLKSAERLDVARAA